MLTCGECRARLRLSGVDCFGNLRRQTFRRLHQQFAAHPVVDQTRKGAREPLRRRMNRDALRVQRVARGRVHAAEEAREQAAIGETLIRDQCLRDFADRRAMRRRVDHEGRARAAMLGEQLQRGAEMLGTRVVAELQRIARHRVRQRFA